MSLSIHPSSICVCWINSLRRRIPKKFIKHYNDDIWNDCGRVWGNSSLVPIHLLAFPEEEITKTSTRDGFKLNETDLITA